MTHFRLVQTAGDIYIGTPMVYLHAVEYPECMRWEESVLALQVRFLFEEGALEDIQSSEFHKMLPSLRNAVRTHGVRIPTLADVQAVELELFGGAEDPREKEEKKSCSVM